MNRPPVTRAEGDAFDARVERCRAELDMFVAGFLDRGYTNEVILAALLREVCSGVLQMHHLGRIDSRFVQQITDRFLANTAKARTPGGRLAVMNSNLRSKR